MSETITVKGFPLGKVEEARELLAKFTAKFEKAAAKAGTVAPMAPTLTAGEPYSVFSCSACGHMESMLALGNECRCEEGYIVEKTMVDLEVTADKPALAGWEFLAVIEPLEGGNLVKRVPGSDTAFDLTAYRTGDALDCDHCNTKRARLETFVVRADGTDPNVPTGTVKKVGRNCLAYFLGGMSPAAIVARLGWEKALRELGESGGGGGRGELVWSFDEFLSWACAVVRKDGFVSKGAAAAYNEAGGNKSSTASVVFHLMVPPFGRMEREEWRKDREEYKPVAADREKAVKVLEWARALEGKNDYEYSLNLIAKQAALPASKAGFMASAVGGYDRATVGAAAKAKREAEVKATAPLGKGIEFEGEVISTSVTHSEEWGSTERMTVKVTNPDGSVWLAWGTIARGLYDGLRCYNGTTEFGVPEFEGSLTRDEMVGRLVRIKATLEPGKEANFVFMKRPSAEWVVYGPVPKAPKKARKAKKETEAA